jgi:hypothetical protein
MMAIIVSLRYHAPLAGRAGGMSKARTESVIVQGDPASCSCSKTMTCHLFVFFEHEHDYEAAPLNDYQSQNFRSVLAREEKRVKSEEEIWSIFTLHPSPFSTVSR